MSEKTREPEAKETQTVTVQAGPGSPNKGGDKVVRNDGSAVIEVDITTGPPHVVPVPPPHDPLEGPYSHTVQGSQKKG